MDIHDIVVGIVAETLHIPRETVTPESNLTDLAADSIMIFELLVAFEKRLGRRVKYDDIAHIETVGDIIAYAESLPPEEIPAS